MLIGYARVSTRDKQDTASQERLLRAEGIDPDRIYLDQGFTGSNRNRPGLTTALAVLRPGDVLVVTKLDRLARSLTDAHALVEEITSAGAALRYGSQLLDLTDPAGKLMFSVLGAVAEFERDLIRQRTREGLAVARAKGKLLGGRPKLSPAQERHLLDLIESGSHSVADVRELFGIGQATVYRSMARERQRRVS